MPYVSNWVKFKLLLWKNFKLQSNRKCCFAMEILIPIFFISLLLIFRISMTPSKYPPKKFSPIPINSLEAFDKKIPGDLAAKMKRSIVYTPSSKTIDEIVQAAAAELKLTSESVENVTALEIKAEEENFFAGVVFAQKMAEIGSDKKFADMNFTLRFPSGLRTVPKNEWQVMQLYGDSPLGPRLVQSNYGGPPSYLEEGFLPLQSALTRAFLKKISNKEPIPIEIQRFPYTNYMLDRFNLYFPWLISLMIVLGFMYPVMCIAKRVTQEKENQLKGAMLIGGLNNWLHWAAWFVQSFIPLAIVAIIIAGILKLPVRNGVSMFPATSYSVLLLFLLIYCIMLICYAFMISALCHKTSSAVSFSGFIMFGSYLVYNILKASYKSMNLACKHVSLFILNVGLGFGFDILTRFERSGDELNLSHISESFSNDELTLADIFLGMFVSSIIYMLFCLYFERITPGEFGVRYKWYYPFTKKFYFFQNKVVKMQNNSLIMYNNNEAFEPESGECCIGIKIRNLRKEFGDKIAVRKVNLNIYQDEITVLLGPNGAGKSTVISMLTGMYAPTYGRIIINGYNLHSHLEDARSSMGYCPQHNVLFDDLSVQDHLYFFGRLKGMDKIEVKREIERFLNLMNLKSKKKSFAHTLSGGMKRKLSLCCALCGSTKVVFCDEPSSGLDPSARRDLWTLLEAEKIGRTILLTTHFMDEADALGDRIAIMNEGEIKCVGSPFYLKKRFGSGYRLVCVKLDGCRPSEVTKSIQKYVPNIEPASDVGAELSYQLPEEHSKKFEILFQDLEENSEDLKISGFGVGLPSLEEVFMKIADIPQYNRKTSFEDVSDETDLSLYDDTDELREARKKNYQWKAMFRKRFLITKRNWLMVFVFLLLVPLIFVTLNIFKFNEVKSKIGGGALAIHANTYPKGVLLLDNSFPAAEGSISNKIFKEYELLRFTFDPKIEIQKTKKNEMQDYLLQLAKNGNNKQSEINTGYLAGATIKEDKITAWFNGELLHSAPLSVNLIYNAMARALLDDADASISVVNHPFPFTVSALVHSLSTDVNPSLGIAFDFAVIMCFVTAFFISHPIKERVTRTKLLQHVLGVKSWIYWLSSFAFDYAIFLIVAFIISLLMTQLTESGYESAENFGRFFFIVIIFGASALSLTYFLSFCFNGPTTGMSWLVIINIFFGVGPAIIILIMSTPIIGFKKESDAATWAFLLFPHFNLCLALNKINLITKKEEHCEKFQKETICDSVPVCCEPDAFLEFSDHGVLKELLYLIGSGLIFFLLVIIIDSDLCYCCKKCIENSGINKPLPTDRFLEEDVQKEKNRITAMKNEQLVQYPLILDHVTKCYKKLVAVNQISLCVSRMECFGLLGVNGAGKTTAFKILTGEVSFSYGEAFIEGVCLKNGLRKVKKEIGYCPQYDALFEDLTAKEILSIYCLIRGVDESMILHESIEVAKLFGFYQYFTRRVKTYSGGNKRKLSTAIACLGNPSIIYLDEPTSGVDPVARRHLWNVLCFMRDSGRSIILTSHSMEECESLCTRVAIMVNGEFQCLGSPQHLKNKFSKGIVLKVKVKRQPKPENLKPKQLDMINAKQKEDIEDVKRFIKVHFETARLQEEYQGLLTFYVARNTTQWSSIFGIMERNLEKMNIENYSVSQTGLEDIFLEFASTQRPDKRTIN